MISYHVLIENALPKIPDIEKKIRFKMEDESLSNFLMYRHYLSQTWEIHIYSEKKVKGP